MFKGPLDINVLGLIILGVIQLINLYYTRRTEKNTNSMKDALVAQASIVGHAAGVVAGKAEAVGAATVIADDIRKKEGEHKDAGHN